MSAPPDVVAHLLRTVVDELADVVGENEGPRQVLGLGVPLDWHLEVPKNVMIVALTYTPEMAQWQLWQVEGDGEGGLNFDDRHTGNHDTVATGYALLGAAILGALWPS